MLDRRTKFAGLQQNEKLFWQQSPYSCVSDFFAPSCIRTLFQKTFFDVSLNLKSFLPSLNSPSSIPSPTYQCTKAHKLRKCTLLFSWSPRFENIMSNLWLIRVKTSETAVLFEIIASARLLGAISPSGNAQRKRCKAECL